MNSTIGNMEDHREAARKALVDLNDSPDAQGMKWELTGHIIPSGPVDGEEATLLDADEGTVVHEITANNGLQVWSIWTMPVKPGEASAHDLINGIFGTPDYVGLTYRRKVHSIVGAIQVYLDEAGITAKATKVDELSVRINVEITLDQLNYLELETPCWVKRHASYSIIGLYAT